MPSKEGVPLTSSIGCINRNHLELEGFNGNIRHNHPALVTCKDKIDIRIKAASN